MLKAPSCLRNQSNLEARWFCSTATLHLLRPRRSTWRSVSQCDFDRGLSGGIPNLSQRRRIHDSGVGKWGGNGNAGQYSCRSSLCTHHPLLRDRNISPTANLSCCRTSRRRRVRGNAVAADLRVVLEVHVTDPANPATLIATSTVLYDGVLANVSGFCTYGLVNALNLHCTIPFTRLLQPVDAEVRSALPGQGYRTRLVGSQTEGAECLVLSSSALQFFPENAPASNELIQVQYRGFGRSLGRVIDPVSIAALQNGNDDGVRGLVREVKTPAPRTSADCENAALALLSDASGPAWSGEYSTWSDFLPGNAADIFPGDAMNVSVASRAAAFQAIVREVDIEIRILGTSTVSTKSASPMRSLRPSTLSSRREPRCSR